MKLIVGLGNPGKEYEDTRHNVGFIYLDVFVKKHLNGRKYKKFNNSLIIDENIEGERVMLMKPQCFMNLSGVEIKKVIEFYKLPIEECLVVYDDIDIEIGKYKLSINSGHGGHNGIRNIIDQLGSKVFLKLRVGIKPLEEMVGVRGDYVLDRFSLAQTSVLKGMEGKVVEIIGDFIGGMGNEALINKHQL